MVRERDIRKMGWASEVTVKLSRKIVDWSSVKEIGKWREERVRGLSRAVQGLNR